MDQSRLDLRGVVHAAQEHGLVAQGDPGVGESREGVADFGGEFLRVVRVDGDVKRVVLFQHRAEFRGDPLRKENGDARADAQELDVRDRAEAGEDLVELRVGEEQGIAAGKEDIADFRVLLKVAERRLPLRFKVLLADAGNDP